MPRLITCCLALTLLTGVSALAQDGGATIIPKREVNEVLLQGLDRLATGRAVSDIVVRHLNVGEENIGVSVVQRTKVEVGDTIIGGAHTHVDEVYYIVSGTGTMVTGGEFVNKESRAGGLLGPNNRGEIRGGVLQYVEPGDIAIIPKGMPHSWHKIDTDTISYIIFRSDPNKVMDLKNEQRVVRGNVNPQPVTDQAPLQIVVIRNWFQELTERVPVPQPMLWEWLIILVIALVVFGPLILKARKKTDDD